MTLLRTYEVNIAFLKSKFVDAYNVGSMTYNIVSHHAIKTFSRCMHLFFSDLKCSELESWLLFNIVCHLVLIGVCT